MKQYNASNANAEARALTVKATGMFYDATTEREKRDASELLNIALTIGCCSEADPASRIAMAKNARAQLFAVDTAVRDHLTQELYDWVHETSEKGEPETVHEQHPSFTDQTNARHLTALANHPHNEELERTYINALFAVSDLERLINKLNKA